MIFKASFDKTVWIITCVVAALFLGLTFIPSFLGKEEVVVAIYLGVVLALIYLITFGFCTLSYKITEDELIVNRPFYNACFKRDKIKDVEVIDENQITGSIRTLGNGGIFGYTGYFANFKLGKMFWYLTRKDKLVLVRLYNNEKIVLSPNEPEKFVERFKTDLSISAPY